MEADLTEFCPTCGEQSLYEDTGSATHERYFRCPAHGRWREKNAAAVAMGKLGAAARRAKYSEEELSRMNESAASTRWDAEKIKRKTAVNS